MELREGMMQKGKRILAIMALILIAAITIALIVVPLMGGSQRLILTLLFCMMVIPTLIYIFIWFTKLIK